MSDYYTNCVIVAGSRGFDDCDLMRKELDEFLADMPPSDTVIISGHARGADMLGEQYARERGYQVVLYPADWDKYGKAAGPIRNAQMAEIATHCVVFWDGVSRGTRNMLSVAIVRDIVTKIVKFEWKP